MSLSLREMRTTRWQPRRFSGGRPHSPDEIFLQEKDLAFARSLATVRREAEANADMPPSMLRKHLLKILIYYLKNDHRLVKLMTGRKESMIPPQGQSVIQIHGLWGVRCRAGEQCGEPVEAVSGQRELFSRVGFWRCIVCEPVWDRLDALTSGQRAELRALHLAAEEGDEVAFTAAFDWQEEHLGLARPGKGTPLVGEAGLWWPAVDWDEVAKVEKPHE